MEQYNRYKKIKNKYSKVICLNNEPFRLSYNQEHKKGDIIIMNPSGFTVKVKKVYRFTWLKQILFKLGYDFKIMDLEEIKNGKI